MSDLAPPPDSARVAAWALWYLRNRVGIPLPIRDPEEADEFAAWDLRRWDEGHPDATDVERDAHYRKTLARAHKSPMVRWAGGIWVAEPPTETQVEAWFEEHPARRIFLLTGPGTGLAVIDVDTYKGGDPTPWIGEARTVVETPSGGLQLWYAEADVPTDNDRLGPGVDRRGRGGGVAAPSGSATPGRVFRSFTLPLTSFPASAMARPPDVPANMSAGTGETPAGFSMAVAPAGSFSTMAEALRGPVGDGHRNAAAKEIVGMLARPRPVPADAIAEALALLAEEGLVGVDPLSRALWRTALESAAPRPEHLVVALVSAWARRRCSPAWSPAAGADGAASSLWRTAITAEAQRAAIPAAPPATPAAPAPAEPGSATAPATAAEDDPTLRYWAPREGDRYDLQKFRARRRVGRVSIAQLPGWRRRGDTGHDHSPFGHGLGPWLDRAMGGIRPARMILLGARKAKGGKTALMHQLAAGLAMLSVERVDAGGDEPLLLVFWATEMHLDDLAERGLARFLGLSQGVFQGDGRTAELDEVEAYLRDECGDLYNRARSRFVRFIEIGKLLQGIPGVEGAEPRRDGPEMLAAIEALVESAAKQVEEETGRKVWRVVVIDPYQRRVEETEDTTKAETAFAKMVRARVDALDWILLLTSDATKASATDEIDPTMPPDIVVTQVTRGSYSMTHQCDVTMAVDVEPAVDQDTDERRALVYVGVTRGARGSDKPLPFRYWRSLGRFVAVDPRPPPPPATAPPTTPNGLTAEDMPPDMTFTMDPNAKPANRRGKHLRKPKD